MNEDNCCLSKFFSSISSFSSQIKKEFIFILDSTFDHNRI